MHDARSTVLYCAHLAIFMQYKGVSATRYSCTLCKPHSQLKIDPTPTHRTRGRIGVPDLRIKTTM